MKGIQKFFNLRSERGFTLTEMLVVMSMSSVIFLGLMQQYATSVQLAHDNNVRIATILEAQAFVQTLGSEIRVLGNGVPFDQANFQIGEASLSDITVPDPINITTSDNSTIVFRLNETGDVYLLTADFDPAATNDIQLTDVSSLDANDPIYLSNSVVSGDDGFYAIIASVSSGTNTITVDPATVVMSPGATFDTGSILEEVPEITYANTVNGITRDSGFGPVLMAPNTTLAVEYLDFNGAALAVPLTRDNVVDSLRSVRITVQNTSSSQMSDGTNYVAEISQVFGIRNLNYLY